MMMMVHPTAVARSIYNVKSGCKKSGRTANGLPRPFKYRQEIIWMETYIITYILLLSAKNSVKIGKTAKNRM